MTALLVISIIAGVCASVGLIHAIRDERKKQQVP
jgi:hypothetical protein